MGTSGAYTGAGGKAGTEVADGLGEWLDSLPGSGGGEDGTSTPDRAVDGKKPATAFPPKVVTGLLGLLGRRSGGRGSSDGPSAGGGSVTGGHSTSSRAGRARAGSNRSLRRLASISGRAGAGAYAFARGDSEELRSLGLNYAELRSLDDPLEVTRRIVNAVCDQQSRSTLEDDEERYVAASVADWVLTQGEKGNLPDAEDIARYAIATIITEILSSELGQAMQNRPDEVCDVAEDELREAAWVLAGQARLNSSAPTSDELTGAIEDGVDRLRGIYGGQS